jgi:hypothetical protein
LSEPTCLAEGTQVVGQLGGGLEPKRDHGF